MTEEEAVKAIEQARYAHNLALRDAREALAKTRSNALKKFDRAKKKIQQDYHDATKEARDLLKGKHNG